MLYVFPAGLLNFPFFSCIYGSFLSFSAILHFVICFLIAVEFVFEYFKNMLTTFLVEPQISRELSNFTSSLQLCLKFNQLPHPKKNPIKKYPLKPFIKSEKTSVSHFIELVDRKTLYFDGQHYTQIKLLVVFSYSFLLYYKTLFCAVQPIQFKSILMEFSTLQRIIFCPGILFSIPLLK